VPDLGVRYEAIDIEIRQLVHLLNQWPGIRTCFSCAGHEEHETGGIESYICFTADCPRALRSLIDVLPNWGAKAAFFAFQPFFRHVGIEVVTLKEPALDPTVPVYRLSIAGMPLFHQRAQLKLVEDAISAALRAEVPTP
jgi:hypothetical protein